MDYVKDKLGLSSVYFTLILHGVNSFNHGEASSISVYIACIGALDKLNKLHIVPWYI